jgi:nucleoside-diphosphate-sugar epimerase
MKYPRILITGSKGLIGRIVTKALVDSFDMYGLDIVGEQTERHSRVDISNFEALHHAFRAMGDVEYVIHLAADRKPDAQWESVLKNNIIGTRNVYEGGHNHGVKKIIFASSTYVTRGYRGIPPTSHEEQHPGIIFTRDPIAPDSDYGVSKAFGEALARQHYERHGLESICLRIGAVSENDDPPVNEELMKIWLSHRDLIQLVKKSILSNVKFGIYFGISNNRARYYDISTAKKEIGYKPQDDAFRNRNGLD